LQALALNDEPSADDEVGHPMLFKPSNVIGFMFDHEDKSIAETAILLSRGAFGERPPIIECTNTFPKCGLFRARVAYQGKMMTILENLVPPPVCRPSVYLDYEPWIRIMVGVEDMLEQEGGGKLRARKTRGQPKYERQITLSGTQRELLTETMMHE
jgi:hypothetical protein